MSAILTQYFADLIKRVEEAPEISNQGKDKDGFYKPKRTILLRHLRLLKDLHAKPGAREMVRASWRQVAAELPPEWLMLDEPGRQELREILG